MTDTFGTPAFLDAFRKPIPKFTSAAVGSVTTAPSVASTISASVQSEASTKPPIAAPASNDDPQHSTNTTSYAQAYTGIRQDSGDPTYFVKLAREFYDKEGIKEKKTVVFSDSLNIELCLEYKTIAEEAGFQPVFGVGTFFTSKTPHRHNHTLNSTNN